MRADGWAKILRHGEGHHEMMAGKLSFKLPSQPLMSLVVLAGGTVPVTAGPVDMIGLPALPTLVDGNSCCFGPALGDGIDHFSVLFGDGGAESIDVLGRVRTEDFRNCRHGQTPSWWS